MTVISRRCFFKGLIVTGSLFCGGWLSDAVSAAEDPLTAEKLKMDLRASTKKQEEYLDDVCEKRDEKIIPAKLVYAAWRYAMKKNKASRVIYFDKCLQILCSREGIKVKFKTF